MGCCGLKDKVIIVTGAAVGIGRVTAVRFALGVSNGLLKWSKPLSANVLRGKGQRKCLKVRGQSSWNSQNIFSKLSARMMSSYCTGAGIRTNPVHHQFSC